MISSLSVMSRWCFLASFLVRYHLRMHWQRIWKTLEKVYLLPRKAASDFSLWSSENFPEHKQLLAVIREWVNWRECGAVLLEPPSRFEEMQETTLLGAVKCLEISRWWSEPKFSSDLVSEICSNPWAFSRSFAQVDVSGVSIPTISLRCVSFRDVWHKVPRHHEGPWDHSSFGAKRNFPYGKKSILHLHPWNFSKSPPLRHLTLGDCSEFGCWAEWHLRELQWERENKGKCMSSKKNPLRRDA